MLYPFNTEINLPYSKYTQTFIYEFYDIFEVASNPRTEAKYKQFGESLFKMRGTVFSSIQFG